jgi:hypothetical protein
VIRVVDIRNALTRAIDEKEEREILVKEERRLMKERRRLMKEEADGDKNGDEAKEEDEDVEKEEEKMIDTGKQTFTELTLRQTLQWTFNFLCWLNC